MCNYINKNTLQQARAALSFPGVIAITGRTVREHVHML